MKAILVIIAVGAIVLSMGCATASTDILHPAYNSNGIQKMNTVTITGVDYGQGYTHYFVSTSEPKVYAAAKNEYINAQQYIGREVSIRYVAQYNSDNGCESGRTLLQIYPLNIPTTCSVQVPCQGTMVPTPTPTCSCNK